jgi:hypothetical protein
MSQDANSIHSNNARQITWCKNLSLLSAQENTSTEWGFYRWQFVATKLKGGRL